MKRPVMMVYESREDRFHMLDTAEDIFVDIV